MAKKEPESDRVLEELERLGAERRPIAGWLEALTELGDEISPAVFERVGEDYRRRLAEIDRRATPLVGDARAAIAAIAADVVKLEGERKSLELDLEELTLRHSLAELTDNELAERRKKPNARIEAIAGELETLDARRERWSTAADQGFAVASAPPAKAVPAKEAPAAAPATAAPVAAATNPAGIVAPPAAGREGVDITAPHPMPPPLPGAAQPSSAAIPLPEAPPISVVASVQTAPHATPLSPPAPPLPPAPPPSPSAVGGELPIGATVIDRGPAPPPSPRPPMPEVSVAADRTVVLPPTPPTSGTSAAPAPRAALVPVDPGSGLAAEFPLATENTIGRVAENSIPVPHGSVSRQHAVLRWSGATWQLVDQGSENGTWVNGERITERVLADQDRVNIGTVRFRFRLG